MVPEAWKLSTLDEIAKISSGGTPSRQTPEYWGGDVPWVTTAEVQFGTILDTAEKITVEGLNNSSAKLFPVDTILMAMYGQGKTRGQVAKLGIEAATNQACAAILLNEGHQVEYYFQFLMSRYEHIREMSNSGGQENLSGGIVKSIQVPVPPLPEQKKIAQILSTWDQAIATNERLLDLARQQKKALMQQLLTSERRLISSVGHRFDGAWIYCNVDEFFKVGSSKRVLQEEWTDSGVPFYRTRELVSLSKNEPFRSEIFISERLFSEIAEKYEIPSTGDFLVSGVGTLGICYQVKDMDRFYFKDGNVLWFKRVGEIDPDFFYHTRVQF